LEFDIIIIGAGPAGCTSALALSNSGLKVALIEKESFPRDKVCGDAIPTRAIKVLATISGELAAAFEKFPVKTLTKQTEVVYDSKSFAINWNTDAYTCTRMEFDGLLFSLVLQHTNTEVYQNTAIKQITRTEDGFVIQSATGKSFTTKLIIGADGAQSVSAKLLTDRRLDRKHHIGAVRAYYTGIEDVIPGTNEIYINKEFLPGYLWIFPFNDGSANVGFGMLSQQIADRKINIKKAFYDFLECTPQLAAKFKNATLNGTLEGHSLPLGSRHVQVCGDGFMLTGDAASLIDPISGDGIGNAMLSGRLAAEQAVTCFKQNDFRDVFILSYEKKLRQALDKEMRFHYKVQKALHSMPFLLDLIFGLTRYKTVRKYLQKLP